LLNRLQKYHSCSQWIAKGFEQLPLLQKSAHTMKKIALLVILSIAGVFTYYFFYSKKDKTKDTPVKQQPATVSKYSSEFNNSIEKVLKNYYTLSEALVNWDTVQVNMQAAALQTSIAQVRFDDLKKDTIIHQTATSYVDGFNTDLKTISDNPDITAKRQAFYAFSQNFYDLLRTVQYNSSTVFMQECPMAFNDTEPGIWLSAQREIRNPYLGTKHPKYKSGMLECGETKDSLNFKDQ
jgi:hypothetical protein